MLQAVRTEGRGAEGGPLHNPASVLLPGMRLLAQLTLSEPGLALSLVQMQVPAGAGAGERADADADLLTLSAAGLSLQKAAAGLSDAETLQLYGQLPRVAAQLHQSRRLACLHACAKHPSKMQCKADEHKVQHCYHSALHSCQEV